MRMPTNAHYNDESLFLDGILESHPEVLDALPAEDREALEVYYLVNQPVPDNIFEYRENLVRQQPHVQARAKSAFDTLLRALGITKFTYTTKPLSIEK